MGWAVVGAKERNPVALKMTRYGQRRSIAEICRARIPGVARAGLINLMIFLAVGESPLLIRDYAHLRSS